MKRIGISDDARTHYRYRWIYWLQCWKVSSRAGDSIIGIDFINDYYDVSLKQARINSLIQAGGARFTFLQQDFVDYPALISSLEPHTFDRIIHLGAQAGVRYSIETLFYPLTFSQI